MTTMFRLFAAFALVGGCLMAQPRNLTMSVPFAFTVPGANLPAGAYTVSLPSEVDRVRLTHEATRRTVFVMTPVPVYAVGTRANDTAYATFYCLEERCTFGQVWPAGGAYGRATLARALRREVASRANGGPVAVVRVVLR